MQDFYLNCSGVFQSYFFQDNAFFRKTGVTFELVFFAISISVVQNSSHKFGDF